MEIFSTVRFELINNLLAYEPSEEKEYNEFAPRTTGEEARR